MAYVDISTLQTIATGQPFAAATLQQIRDNDEFLVDPPTCSVFNTTAQSVATSTAAQLTADSENRDNDSMHSTASNTSRITVQTAGTYLFATTVKFAADADGSRRLDFFVNGTTVVELMNLPAGSAVSTVNITGVKVLDLAASDYVEVRVTHTAGNNLDVTLLEFAALFQTR